MIKLMPAAASMSKQRASEKLLTFIEIGNMSKSKEKYFNLSRAVDEFKHESFGPGEKALAGLKIVGKGLFNTIKFTATEVIPTAVDAQKRAVERQKNSKK